MIYFNTLPFNFQLLTLWKIKIYYCFVRTKPKINNVLLFFVCLVYTGFFAFGCAKKDIDKEEYIINNKVGACAEVAYKESRAKMDEANRLKALNRVREADIKQREAYDEYLKNEIDYINLQGQISNVRTALAKQKHKLDVAGDSADKTAAAILLKNAENMINICKPLEATDFINKAQNLLNNN